MDIGIPLGELASLGCAFAWACAVILFRKSGETVSPVALNLFKNSVAVPLFVLTLIILGIPFFPIDVSTTDWWILLLSGAAGTGIGDTLFFISLNRLGAGRQAIVDCSYSPMVILCAFLYLNEPLSIRLLLSAALIGSAIVVGTYKSKDDDSEKKMSLLVGVILGISSMLIMAMSITVAKPVLERTDIVWATTVRLIGAYIPLAIFGFMATHRKAVKEAFTPGSSWKLTIPAALLGTYVAMLLWLTGMKYTFASRASLLNQTSTFFILIMATLFLKEKLSGRKILAILMGFGGAAILLVKGG